MVEKFKEYLTHSNMAKNTVSAYIYAVNDFNSSFYVSQKLFMSRRKRRDAQKNDFYISFVSAWHKNTYSVVHENHFNQINPARSAMLK